MWNTGRAPVVSLAQFLYVFNKIVLMILPVPYSTYTVCTWYVVPATRYLVRGSPIWYGTLVVPGTRYLVRNLGIRCITVPIPGTGSINCMYQYLVPGTRYYDLVLVPWWLCSILLAYSVLMHILHQLVLCSHHLMVTD